MPKIYVITNSEKHSRISSVYVSPVSPEEIGYEEIETMSYDAKEFAQYLFNNAPSYYWESLVKEMKELNKNTI